MNASTTWRRLVAPAVAVCCAAVAGGQTVTYLVPAVYSAGPGENVAVHVESGEGAVVRRAAWPTENIGWLFVRAAGVQENRDRVGPSAPSGDSISVPLARPGVTMIGLDTRPAVANVAGERFKAFVGRVAADPSHGDALAAIADEEQVRVRRVESAKTLVRTADPAGEPASQSPVAQSKTGQAVEIRALADPTMVPVGSDLPVRAYVRGDKRVGVKVLATCAATGKTQEVPTDSSGSCHFRISDAGVWRIEFHDVEKLENDPDADWVVHSATLTFETSGTGAGK